MIGSASAAYWTESASRRAIWRSVLFDEPVS